MKGWVGSGADFRGWIGFQDLRQCVYKLHNLLATRWLYRPTGREQSEWIRSSCSSCMAWLQ